MLIVNDEKEFIFIKPRRVAGTSIVHYITLYLFECNECYKDLYEYMKPREIKKTIGKDKFNNYFKFTVIRNPYDMVVSWFWWINRDEPKMLDLETKEVIKILKTQLL